VTSDFKPETLGLYVHIPWCVKKCPYCDFNSHVRSGPIPEKAYLDNLIEDLKADLLLIDQRPITSIFFGGGTPSLMPSHFFYEFLNKAQQLIPFAEDVEITLEANPGTLECDPFPQLLEAGINRVSLGIQSLSSSSLKRLGRIHSAALARQAIESALATGFRSVNADLMHALPEQNIEEAIGELKALTQYQLPHISWYQLTLEPNTVFFNSPPKLPCIDTTADIGEQGAEWLLKQGYEHYEVSAFSQPGHACQHNLNYWQFGDYLGLGAGAHGKLTLPSGDIVRTQRTRTPADYLKHLSSAKRTLQHTVAAKDILFEYSLNRFRLFQPLNLKDMVIKTKTAKENILTLLKPAFENQWLMPHNNTAGEVNSIELTPLGRRFADAVVSLFLPEEA